MEIELQYLYRGDQPAMIPVELADFVLGDSEAYSVLDTYHDTDRLALRRAGCSLRIRSQGNLPRPLLTWKGPATRRPDGSKSREELQVALDHVPRDGTEVAAVLHRLDLWERVCDPTPESTRIPMSTRSASSATAARRTTTSRGCTASS